MIDKIKQTIKELTDAVQEQASSFGESAKEKGYQIIDDWLQIFPKLELYKLEIVSFSLGVAISPSLEVDLVGKHEDFSQERLQQILTEVKGNTALTLVFNTIKTTYNLHRKTYATLRDPLIVKIKIRISPEVRVFIGSPGFNDTLV
ncbi:MAG: hypothetical protein SFU99_15015 [Saprospiraceae bacterium]|nr:hypothetical protein [Saprospiraceae bacterium]